MHSLDLKMNLKFIFEFCAKPFFKENYIKFKATQHAYQQITFRAHCLADINQMNF